MYNVDLNNDWLLTFEPLASGHEMHCLVERKAETWFKANLPCDIHEPLIREDFIKEPLNKENFYDCEWTENKSWWFKKTFEVDEEILKSDVVELKIDMLDSGADVILNGFHIAHHSSSFYPFVHDVKRLLRSKENVLLVRLSSGVEHVSEADMEEITKCIGIIGKFHRGDERRAFVRKPQYVFGWDWGPRLVTCGMEGVSLNAYNKYAVRNARVYTKAISLETRSAALMLTAEIDSFYSITTQEVKLKIDILHEEVIVFTQEREMLLTSGLNFVTSEFSLENADFWWPNGMGEQALYNVRLCVESVNNACCYPEFKFGIRTVALNQDKIGCDERLFAIVINGIKTFCKGGNWIPADALYFRVTDEKYDTLLSEAAEADFNMLRVWGGGIYERERFYNKCDELGIMVWQDFMFACSLYPDQDERFMKEVTLEMDYQTKRLAKHPSVVMWCGNNENQMGYTFLWEKDKKHPTFAGEKIFNELAPRIVYQNCPDIPYWNGSPYGGDDPNSDAMGDKHYWFECTFAPKRETKIHPEVYDTLTSKFVSEFGHIGACTMTALKEFHGDAEINKDSSIWKSHNNYILSDPSNDGLMELFISTHYTDPEKLDISQFVLYTGLCQGLMLQYSLEAIRSKPQCYGAIFWMYNDCWGEIGWSIIDYYLKRKVAYYFVKRALAHVKLIMRETDAIIRVTGVNDTKDTVEFDASYGYLTFDGNELYAQSRKIELKPFSRQVVLEFGKGDYDFTKGTYFIKPEVNTQEILPAVLRTGVFKNLKLLDSELTLSNYNKEGDVVNFTVSSDVYTHAVHFNLDDSIRCSDEYFDLLPSESRNIVLYDVPEDFSRGSIVVESVRMDSND